MALTVPVSDVVSNSSDPLLQIHPSWTRVQLREIAKVLNGFAFASNRFTRTAGMPLLRIRDIGRHATETFFDGPYDPLYIVKTGDLLVGMDGDFNCARWRGPEALLNQRVCKIEVTTSSYDPGFLEIVLPGYLRAINEWTSSVTVKHLSSRSVEDIPLPLPPLPEQHRIVAKIEELFSELDAGVAVLKRVKAALKRYRASVLKAACEGRLVPSEVELAREEGREYEPAGALLKRILIERRAKWEAEHPGKTYVEPAAPDMSALPQLPKKWCWTSLGQAFEVAIGGTPSRGKTEYWNGSFPWVSSGEVRFNRVYQTRESITPEGLGNSNAKLHPPGTVLLAMIGEGKTRGQSALLEVAATTNQNVAAILCADSGILPQWVFYWLESRYEETRKRGSGGMQYALNSERIRAFALPLPPLPEQQRIVTEVERRLSVVEETEATVKANLTRAGRLRQAILKRAFEGKLVVQNPDDEP